MAEFGGTVKADLLIRLHGAEEVVTLGTIEMSIRAERVADGVVECAVDTRMLGRIAHALAAEAL